MQLRDKIVVITGAASGIGAALARRFHAEGTKLIVCADIDGDGAAATAAAVNGVSFRTDVSQEADIKALIETVEAEHGAILDAVLRHDADGAVALLTAHYTRTAGVILEDAAMVS